MKQRIVPRKQAANLAKGEGADQLMGTAVGEEGVQLKRALLAEVLLASGAVVDLEALRCAVPTDLLCLLDGMGGRGRCRSVTCAASCSASKTSSRFPR